MAADWDSVKGEVARLARNRRTRLAEFSKSAPCVWNPSQVIDPEVDMPFTEAGAWEFIAQLVENDHAFEPVVLRHPPGEVAFETKVMLRANLPMLYIKIQIKSGRILGRSFHNSTRGNNGRD